MNSDIIVGCVENVDLPGFGITQQAAKIDTGAYSGALHCSVIREVMRGGQRTLQFKPSDTGVLFETTDFEELHIRSSTGHKVKRYNVPTTIRLFGKTYPIIIGVSNRKDMRYEILLGRRFLRENNIIVDVRINDELDNFNGAAE